MVFRRVLSRLFRILIDGSVSGSRCEFSGSTLLLMLRKSIKGRSVLSLALLLLGFIVLLKILKYEHLSFSTRRYGKSAQLSAEC